jgi:arginyl-tRNA synthetase
VSVAGGYVNILVDQQKLYNDYLKYILECKNEYGKTNSNVGKLMLIDFSSPNIAKPLGIGHLRSTIIGHALANIYEWTGFSVVRDNHLGDWGAQFGELLMHIERGKR